MAHSDTAGKGKDRKDSVELALLALVRRGDRRAFADLYRDYHPRLYGYLRRLISNTATIEEVLDDVMYVVWKDARKFRGKAAVSSWIFGIAYRKALSALRSERRFQAPLDRHIDADSVVAESAVHDDSIQVALSHLSDDHRQVIVLTYFGGFSYREIAEISDCPVNTVKTRMFHARRRLRVLLPALESRTNKEDRDSA